VLYDGYCHDCGKPVGKCDLGGLDWTFCRRCAKAREVYTPPGRSALRLFRQVMR